MFTLKNKVILGLALMHGSFSMVSAQELANRAELTKQAEEKFAALDTDKNGSINLAEYTTDCVTNKSMNATTHAAQIAQGFKSVDGDGDGKLIPGEIIGTILWGDADKKRKAMDTNSDNFVNAAEYTASQKGMDQQKAQAAFNKVDSNNDGNIATSELFQSNVNIWLNGPGSEKVLAEAKAAKEAKAKADAAKAAE